MRQKERGKTNSTGDHKKSEIRLPSNLSYRELYVQWVYERGYEIKKDINSCYGKLQDYPKREDITETLPVCSWQGFRSIWKETFPHLKIPPSTGKGGRRGG